MASRQMRWLSPESAISGLMLALLALCALTFNRYGFTTDELNGFVRAQNIQDYFASGGQDTEKIAAFHPRNFYGAMADVLALWTMQLVPGIGFDSRHLVSALFGVAGIFFTYRLGELLGGRWAGVAAAALLALTPMWLGYMFINLKDVPFAAALVAASYFGVRILGEAQRPHWSTMAGLAIWCGALGTAKLTGILLLGVSVLVLLGFWMWERGRPSLKTFALRALLAAGLGLIGIAIFAVAFWPQLYLFAPAQVFDAIVKFLNYDPWKGMVLLNGAFFDQDSVPRYYLVTYLLITMPLVPLALYVFSIPAAIHNRQYAVLGAVALPVLFLAIQAITDAQVYTGFRQFLFTVPFLCIGAGYCLVAIGRLGRGRWPKAAALLLFAGFAGWSAYTMASLFPYQYSAYNALAGGTAGAQQRYYIDVWRSAQREALQLIDNQLPPGEAQVRISACGSPLNFERFPRLVRVAADARHDYLIRLPRCALENPVGYEIVGEVRRGDVLFATVLRPAAASGTARGASEAPGNPE